MEILILLGVAVVVVLLARAYNRHTDNLYGEELRARAMTVKREPATGVPDHRLSPGQHRAAGSQPPPLPRRITSFDFEIVRREATSIEQEIAAAVNGNHHGDPIITLVSGERLVVREVLLFDVNKVAEINSLKAQAGNELQGFTTGLGFWGSPGWVIGGALALGAVESMISNAKQKTGLRLLKLAAEKFDQLPDNSVFVSVDRIRSLQAPNPQNWSAMTSIGNVRFIHNGEDFVTVRTANGEITFRWSQVTSYVPPREARPLLPVSAAA